MNKVGEEEERTGRGEKGGVVVVSSKQDRKSGEGDSHSSQTQGWEIAGKEGIEIPGENTLIIEGGLVRERKGNEGKGDLRVEVMATGEEAQERGEEKVFSKLQTGDMEIEVQSQMRDGPRQVFRALDTNMMQVSAVKIERVQTGTSSTWNRLKVGMK